MSTTRSYGLSDSGQPASYLGGAITGLWRTGENEDGSKIDPAYVNRKKETDKAVSDPHWNFVGLRNANNGSYHCQSQAQAILDSHKGSAAAVVTGAPVYNLDSTDSMSWVPYAGGVGVYDNQPYNNTDLYQPANWISAVNINGKHQITGGVDLSGKSCSDPSQISGSTESWSRWIYSTKFTIDASKVNPKSVSLKLYGAVDNFIQVCINGLAAANCQPEIKNDNGEFSFKNPQLIEFATVSSGSFHGGENTLYFVVRSGYTNQGLIITGYNVSAEPGYSLTPKVGLASTVIPQGQTPSLKPSVKNSGGLTVKDVEWKLQRVVVTAGNPLLSKSSYDGVESPESYLAGFGGTNQALLSQSLHDFTWNPSETSLGTYKDAAAASVGVGKYICYMLSIEPYTSQTEGWRSSIECAVVAYRPYFQIIGGDIIAGGKVNGYNQNGLNINADPDTTAYAGAGTTLAAIVGGTSKNFVTGSLLSTGVSTKSGGGLGFSNASLATNETAKGFVPLPSTPTVDLSGAHTNWASVGNLSTCTAKCVYDVAPGTTIAGTVSAGADITLYAATGNIYLGNITYNYGSLDTIPRLTVYTAAGNIIVANTTTELHGVFIAAGGAADTSKGRFYSCGTGVNSPITYATVTNQCGTALTVYGAVIADKLVLARTPGTFIPGQPNSNPAEKFVFGPEVWLHHNTTTTSGGSAAPVFDQYFSLPPVL